jgi:hypothetical protein
MVWPLLAKAALPLRAGIVIVVMDTLLLVAFCLLNTEEEQASALRWYTQKGYFFAHTHTATCPYLPNRSYNNRFGTPSHANSSRNRGSV